jgi:hypothetical protein
MSVDVQNVGDGRWRATVNTRGGYAGRVFGNHFQADVARVGDEHFRATVKTGKKPLTMKGMRGIGQRCGPDFKECTTSEGAVYCVKPPKPGWSPRPAASARLSGAGAVGKHYHTWKDLIAPDLHGPCGWDAYQCGWWDDQTPMCCPGTPGRPTPARPTAVRTPGVIPPKRGTVAARGGVGAHRAIMSAPDARSFGNWVGTMPLVYGGAFAAHQRRVPR